ncbi:hypothetical protein SRHO_G00076480 [Serrasalmus rhombeus]
MQLKCGSFSKPDLQNAAVIGQHVEQKVAVIGQHVEQKVAVIGQHAEQKVAVIGQHVEQSCRDQYLHAAVEEVLPVLMEQRVCVLLLGESCDTDGIVRFSDKINAASDERPPMSLRSKVTMKSPALYIYTSGTTGFPKAAVINHERVWMASHLQFMLWVSSSDIIYICLPLYHSSGFLMGLTGAIERGITVVLKRKFSASQFWDDCRKHNVTVIQYIGEIMRYLCNTPKTDRDRVHSVWLAFGNGIRGDTWMEFLQRFGNVRVTECYGSTEGNIGFVNYVGKIGATGRVNMFLKRTLSYALIKYDTEKEEPLRNSRGFCEEVPTGESGLLVTKITNVAPFSGYASNQQQTDRKKLRNVFVEGDLYFNSGDLLKADGQGFLYFQDRIGDTFRWKGENVATSEVADVLISVDFIEEANVYGVKVPGHEGRIGMAVVKLKEGRSFDGGALFEQAQRLLPAYARPHFIRIQVALDVTSTFKQVKVRLVEEGFNPSAIRDPLYFLEDRKRTYRPVHLLHGTLPQAGHAMELQQPFLPSAALGGHRTLWDLCQGSRGRGFPQVEGGVWSGGREFCAAAHGACGSSLALTHQVLIDHGLQPHPALGQAVAQLLRLLLLPQGLLFILRGFGVGAEAEGERAGAEPGLHQLGGRALDDAPVPVDVLGLGELGCHGEADNEFGAHGGRDQEHGANDIRLRQSEACF